MLDMRGFMVAAAVFAALGGGAIAQTPQVAAPPIVAGDSITITGGATDDQIRDFVGKIAVPSGRGEDQLARWDRRICPGVMGLKTELARGVLDRIAHRAISVGLDVGDPGCKANILITVSLKPDEIAKTLYEQFGSRIGRYDTRGMETRGRTALQAFVNSDAPVRWWHVANTVTRDGESLNNPASSARGTAPVVNLTGNLSLITKMTRQDFASAFVILDAAKLQGVDFNMLADFIAMVALAQVDPDADASGLPSILNLFAVKAGAQAPLTGMTDWDLAYLRGLYNMERESGSSRRQESDIARSIARDVAQ